MIEDAISFWTEIQRFEDMLAADPRSYCFVPLSELYRKLGLLDDAVSVAAKGCGLHPDYPGGFFALGAAYNAKGQKAEARKALERAVALKPDHIEALKLLGQVYVEEGRMDLAEQVLGRVLRENPEDTETTLLLRSIAGTMTRPEEEVLEDVEVLEELEVIEEFEEADELTDLGAAFPEKAAPAEDRWDLSGPQEEPAIEGLESSADFWAIGTPEESGTVSGFGDADELAFEEPLAFEESDEMAFEEAEETAEPFPAAAEPAGQPRPGKDPLTTATMAELYLSQGFVERALSIYQELSAADPTNGAYRLKVAEVKALQEAAPAAVAAQAEAPAPQAEAPSGQLNVEEELSRWLENIRRRRDGV